MYGDYGTAKPNEYWDEYTFINTICLEVETSIAL